jgi:hypothetical protein
VYGFERLVFPDIPDDDFFIIGASYDDVFLFIDDDHRPNERGVAFQRCDVSEVVLKLPDSQLVVVELSAGGDEEVAGVYDADVAVVGFIRFEYPEGFY